MVGKKIIIFLIIAPLLGISLAGVRIFYTLYYDTYQNQSTEFEVRNGEGFASINQRLYQRKLIPSAKLFYHYSRYRGIISKFKAGDYKIKKGMNTIDIIDMLIKGTLIAVTIPEGKNIFEIAQILKSKGITDKKKFLQLARDPSFCQELNIPADSLEGYLYPDTYHFSPRLSPKKILSSMVNLFHAKVKEVDFSANPLGLNRFQLITLASIVEKETGAGFERPIISGVFYNRLKKKMRLQSDPTIIYGIYEKFDGDIRYRDLKKKTPYNTYRINGLPKGPIANPGINAIRATLNPKKHRYLYFVSQNDGTHIFSETYKQHLAAVKKYQKRGIYKQGRSWRDLSKDKRATNK